MNVLLIIILSKCDYQPDVLISKSVFEGNNMYSASLFLYDMYLFSQSSKIEHLITCLSQQLMKNK